MYVPITSRFSTRIAQNGMKIFYFLFLRDRSVECVINDCGTGVYSSQNLNFGPQPNRGDRESDFLGFREASGLDTISRHFPAGIGKFVNI